MVENVKIIDVFVKKVFLILIVDDKESIFYKNNIYNKIQFIF